MYVCVCISIYVYLHIYIYIYICFFISFVLPNLFCLGNVMCVYQSFYYYFNLLFGFFLNSMLFLYLFDCMFSFLKQQQLLFKARTSCHFICHCADVPVQSSTNASQNMFTTCWVGIYYYYYYHYY